MQLYCGIDLHSNNSVVSLINDEDQLICENDWTTTWKTLSTTCSPIKMRLVASLLSPPITGTGSSMA